MLYRRPRGRCRGTSRSRVPFDPELAALLFLQGNGPYNLTPRQVTEMAVVVGRTVFDHEFNKTIPKDFSTAERREKAMREASVRIESVLRRLIVHPSARRGAWLALLDSPVRTRAAPLVAAHESAMRQAEIRRKLIGFTVDADVLRAVIARGSVRDYRDAFHRIVALEREHRDGRWAAVLAAGTPKQLSALKPDDVADALLSSGPVAHPYLLLLLQHWSPKGPGRAT